MLCQFCQTFHENQDDLLIHQTTTCTEVAAQEAHDYLEMEEEQMRDLVAHFEALKVVDLKAELKKRGLRSDGKKDELKQRLIEAEGLSQVICDDAGEEEDIICNQEAAAKLHGDAAANLTSPNQSSANIPAFTSSLSVFLTSSPSTKSLEERLVSLRRASETFSAPTSPCKGELDHETLIKATTAMIVDIDDMKGQLSDLLSFKDQMLRYVNSDTITKLNNRTKALEKENADLIKEVLQLKKLHGDALATTSESSLKASPVHGNKSTDCFIVPKKVANYKRSNSDEVIDRIPLRNRFSALAFHNNNQWMCEDIEQWDSVVLHEENGKDQRNQAKKRPSVVVQQNPESNILLHRDKKTVPGNSSYSTITDTGKTVGIFGDSMVKRILGHRIGNDLHNATARVRPFLGATAAGLDYHIKPELVKMQYDKVVICAGTNNVPRTKRSGSDIWMEQSPDEIAQEIINTGYTCKDHGVNDVYISLLCDRRYYSNKIDEINKLLIQYCRAAHFYYIDHSNIKLGHLYDGLHIDSKYIHLYANNISQMLNVH